MDNKSRLSAIYPVVGVEAPAQTAVALQQLFGFEPVFEADWYVHLKRPGSEMQVGFVRYDHISVPMAAKRPVEGTAFFVTIDAADVSAIWGELEEQLDVVVPLTDEEWGQRHFICRLPGNVMVDVVQLLPAAA